MNIIEKCQIKHYHSARLEQGGGESADSEKRTQAWRQGWKTDAAQLARFEVIAGLTDFNQASVLDVGCGCGDLKAYLAQRFAGLDYIGLDLQQDFIEAATGRYKDDTNTWFHLADFSQCQLPLMDIVVACGALSYRCENLDYYRKMIEKLYSSATRVLIFNMLDNDTFNSGPLIVSHDRKAIYQFCQAVCANVTLKTDYLDNDFTIMMAR
jgi:trans-aconitate methyltransferase